jgi:hypothetical protein
LPISVKVSSPFDIKTITLEIDGTKVANKDESFSYTYSVPDSKKNSSLTIKASVEDKNGNSASKNITISTNIP